MFPSPAATRTIQRDCNKESTMISESATILIVEDEQDIRELLAYNLEKEGYATVQAADGKEGLELARSRKPDLILLDLMLPKMDGLAVCRELERDSGTVRIPIIMLTARGEDVDRILGFELGADDYITKPYNIPILLARVKAVLRRGGGPAEPDVVEAGGLRLSLTRGTVSADGRTAELSRNELRILAHLMTHAGEIVSRADLIEALWDSQIYIDDNTLSVNVTRLRGKLEALGVPGMIRTRRGMGYQYDGA